MEAESSTACKRPCFCREARITENISTSKYEYSTRAPYEWKTPDEMLADITLHIINDLTCEIPDISGLILVMLNFYPLLHGSQSCAQHLLPTDWACDQGGLANIREPLKSRLGLGDLPLPRAEDSWHSMLN